MKEVLTRLPPCGEDLIHEAGYWTSRVLSEASPAFKSRQHLFMTEVSFGELAELQFAEREDLSQQNQVLFPRLLATGMPREELERGYFSVSKDTPIYLNPQKPQLMIIRDILIGLSSKDQAKRARAAVSFASIFTQAIVASLPYLDNPYWDGRNRSREEIFRPMVKAEFDQYYAALEAKYKNPQTKRLFNMAKKKIDHLIYHPQSARKPKFIPVGAAVWMVFPGQTLSNAEFGIGKEFNNLIIRTITDSVMDRVIRLLKEKGVLPGYKMAESTDRQLRSEQIKMTGVLRRIGLERYPDLIKAYLLSDIPCLYCACDDSKINVWDYPKF